MTKSSKILTGFMWFIAIWPINFLFQTLCIKTLPYILEGYNWGPECLLTYNIDYYSYFAILMIIAAILSYVTIKVIEKRINY